jgi:WD40 repeat protein
MAPLPQRSPIEKAPKRKQFPWILGIIVSIGLMAILAFVILTLLILQSQGITKGINTLTIISIVVGFVIGVFSLLFSFLQWHHPQPLGLSEPLLRSLLQPTALNRIEHLPSPSPPTGPAQLLVQSNVEHIPSPAPSRPSIDWGEAPNNEQFYGRERELANLKQWLVDDHCHLVAILGMGGIGKTSLAATLVDQVKEHFDHVFWRSLLNAPPLSGILQECIQFFSDQQHIILPEEEDRQISLLLESFRTCRCLLVLDNVESIVQEGSQAGQYREDYEGYGRLLQRIGESRHQSCLLITSREKPKEVALLEGEVAATRSSHLAGLRSAEGQVILKDKGLQGTEHTWEALITHYKGNPLALKLVAQVIREVFGGGITAFLKDGEVFFRDIRDVLEQQVARLSALEVEIVSWLAIEREAIALDDLQEDITHPVSKGELQEALRSLRRRQLIETSATSFTLHPVIMEYLTVRFVDRVYEEIRTGILVLLESHALLKAQTKDYLLESQRRLILLPLVQRLLTIFGEKALEQRFQSLLATLREQHDHRPSYAAENVLNLLIQLGCALRGYDFSHLVVWQAYLRGVDLPEVNFAHANLATSVFTDTFGMIPCVTFSPQGDLLVAGTATGEIRFWYAASSTPLQTIQAHIGRVTSLTFSPDGSILASSSHDRTFRLWEVSSGQCLKILESHTSEIWSVAFSPDGKTLASGSWDQTIRLWEVSSGQCLKILEGHTSVVWSVAFSPDGKTLASGSNDRMVRLWDTNSGECLKILQGHTDGVWLVAFSPDGKTLASGSSWDQTVRLWEVSSGQCLKILEGHTNWVYSATFSPDGSTLASGGIDQMIRLWEVSSGQCLKTLQSHTKGVSSVAFSPDGKTLASGSWDQTIRLWEVSSGQCLKTLQGYTNPVASVAFSPDGSTLASGSLDQTIRLWEMSSGQCLKTIQEHASPVSSVAFSPDGNTLASGTDQTLRLWEVSSGQCLKTLQGHTGGVSSVAFSPDGKTLASGSWDQTIQLWEVSSGQCLKTLQGHTEDVNSVAFSPDGSTLASGTDQTIRLWEVSSGQCLKTIQGHASPVNSVAFSPDGSTLASGSWDQTIRLWEVSSGQCLKTIQGHTHRVYSVAFSPDGKTLASGSEDRTVRLWEVSSGQCLKTLQGHTGIVRSMAFSPDGQTLASGSDDGAIKHWDTQTGACLHTLRSDRPYERMNITQVKGLTEGQKATLRLLGAIEEEGQEPV